MSENEKPKPESLSEAIAGVEDAPVAGASNVISIDQARAELLRRSKGARPTPPRGTTARRARSREVPAPVTLAPGEHDSVIVADTPAARAHIEQRTVHPGETPNQTHEKKKVRLKTSIDPRRQKTQAIERRSATEPPAPASSAPASSTQSARQSAPPASQRPSSPSLARPRPLPPPSRGAPLFAVGIAIAAALAAVLVYTLTRPRIDAQTPAPSVTTAAVTAPPPRVDPPPPVTATATQVEAPSATASSSAEPPAPTATASGTATASATASATAAPPASSSATTAAPPKTAKTSAPAVPSAKQTSSPVLVPTATPKPTTNVLPFGKEEN